MIDFLQDYFAIYQDPMFIKFPVITLALSVGSFLIFALPWTLLAWLDPKWAQPYKIQQKPFQVEKYFWPNIARIIVNTCMMFLLLVLAWPLLRFANMGTGPTPAWYVFAIQIGFFLLLDDFLFYWMHRYMHENKWLLRNVHSVHHRIKNTCALDGPVYHDFHHARFKGNYAGALSYLDRFYGTYIKEYLAYKKHHSYLKTNKSEHSS